MPNEANVFEGLQENVQISPTYLKKKKNSSNGHGKDTIFFRESQDIK